MLRVLIETSIFVQLFKKFWAYWSILRFWFIKINKNSLTNKIICRFCNNIRSYVRNSFLGRITELEEKNIRINLSDSKFIVWILRIYTNYKYRLFNYSKASMFVNSKKELQKELDFVAVKIGSIIVINVILINIFGCMLLHKEVNVLGWIIRILFLFISLSGLFCNASWQDIKKTSYFIGRLSNIVK